jgi:cellulose biosynthesis protein BcsQ
MTNKHKWDVFVSHNRRDKRWVRDSVDEWRASGLRVFFDEDSISPGEDVVSAIEDAIANSRFVVLVLSPASIASNWVALEASITLFQDADSLERRLIPVRIEQIDTSSLRPAIRRLNCVDLSNLSTYQREYGRLLSALGIGKPMDAGNHDMAKLDDMTGLLPLRVRMPVLSIMGTKGGAGKTTVVVAMAELIASTGRSVLIVDADLESAGVTKYLGRNATARPQVWTLLDAAFAKQSDSDQIRRPDLGAWDVTPSYLRESRFGRIYLIPARHAGDNRIAYNALANIHPDTRRNRAALEIVAEAVYRSTEIAQNIGAVLIDSGAENNPLVSAGMTAADESYIVSSPHAEFARAVPDAERTHRERYPEYPHKDMHVVVNQATPESKRTWSHYADVHFVMEDPAFRASAAAGKVDFEGVGLNNLYLQVLRVLQRTLPSTRHDILPDPIDVWIEPYMKQMRDFPDQLLARPGYRFLSHTTVSLVVALCIVIAFCGLTIGKALRGPWDEVSVEAQPDSTSTVAELVAEMSELTIPEQLQDCVELSGRTVVVKRPLSPEEITSAESALANEAAVKALRQSAAVMNDRQSIKISTWSFVAIAALGVLAYRIARFIPLMKRKKLLRKLVALRDSGNGQEFRKWVAAILSKGDSSNELKWLRRQYRKRLGDIDPMKALRDELHSGASSE